MAAPTLQSIKKQQGKTEQTNMERTLLPPATTTPNPDPLTRPTPKKHQTSSPPSPTKTSTVPASQENTTTSSRSTTGAQ